MGLERSGQGIANRTSQVLFLNFFVEDIQLFIVSIMLQEYKFNILFYV